MLWVEGHISSYFLLVKMSIPTRLTCRGTFGYYKVTGVSKPCCTNLCGEVKQVCEIGTKSQLNIWTTVKNQMHTLLEQKSPTGGFINVPGDG